MTYCATASFFQM